MAHIPAITALSLCFCLYAAARDCSECSLPRGRALHRSLFPPDFVFGVGTSAYQVEGAMDEGGKGLTIWDEFANNPENVLDGTNAQLAADQYHRYKEDAELLEDLGVDAIRISIAWTRIFPDGRGESVNQEGIAYYNNLINSLVEKGVQPYVTIFHWDLPLALEKSYGGWLSREIIKDILAFARVCFEAFGDRVKHWMTINEPNVLSQMGYNSGLMPPKRCSNTFMHCTSGNSTLEPYVVFHHMILAHAAIVKLYRESFQAKQGGLIGIDFFASWFEPLTNSVEDSEASRRALVFELGWGMHPLTFGDYPNDMHKNAGDRLPKFTKEEALMVKGSADFVGINYYTASYASNTHPLNVFYPTFQYQDTQARITSYKAGSPIGAIDVQFNIVPWGILKLLHYITQHYGDIPIMITENGINNYNGTSPSGTLFTRQEELDFFGDYLKCLTAALRNGANVKAYFVWSFLDGWEWLNGYSWRYGLYSVDQQHDFKRQAKQSALWFKSFLRRIESNTSDTHSTSNL